MHSWHHLLYWQPSLGPRHSYVVNCHQCSTPLVFDTQTSSLWHSSAFTGCEHLSAFNSSYLPIVAWLGSTGSDGRPPLCHRHVQQRQIRHRLELLTVWLATIGDQHSAWLVPDSGTTAIVRLLNVLRLLKHFFFSLSLNGQPLSFTVIFCGT